jgi:hypothetical protein
MARACPVVYEYAKKHQEYNVKVKILRRKTN